MNRYATLCPAPETICTWILFVASIARGGTRTKAGMCGSTSIRAGPRASPSTLWMRRLARKKLIQKLYRDETDILVACWLPFSQFCLGAWSSAGRKGRATEEYKPRPQRIAGAGARGARSTAADERCAGVGDRRSRRRLSCAVLAQVVRRGALPRSLGDPHSRTSLGSSAIRRRVDADRARRGRADRVVAHDGRERHRVRAALRQQAPEGAGAI